VAWRPDDGGEGAAVVLGCGEKRRGVGRGAVWNGVLEGSFYRAGGGVPRR
jgi:hypothetical protein